jgi:stringent starvation protein B
MSHPLPPKKEVALALLERSWVHLHLDPRVAAVVVPPWFKKQAQLVLQIGLNLPVPIPDLRLDDEGMSCTLSFNRSPFFCVVPWPSVFAMVGEDGRGMIWPEDVPPEVQEKGQAQEAAAKREPQKRPLLEEVRSDAPKAKRPRKKPQLARVPESDGRTPVASPRERLVPISSGPSSASSNAKGSPARAARKPKRELPPYLRVVK